MLHNELILLQKFLVSHKALIVNLFRVAHVTMLALFGVAVYLLAIKSQLYFLLFDFGGKFGTAAFGLYVLTLIPGILRRFQIFPLLAASLMLFRGQIGVLMFYTAIVHMGLTTTIPMIVAGKFNPEVFQTHHFLGMVSLWLLLPLWVTSNNFSKKKLGRCWKKLHRLTYIALLFIFLHIAWQGEGLMVVAGFFILLEIGSWMVYWRRKNEVANTVGET